MELFIHKGTDDEPEIILDEAKNTFRISGISTPEDAVVIFTKVLNWINKVVPNLENELKCEFFFIYLSSASHKMIYAILKQLEKYWKTGKPLNILWKYEDNDDDMKELAEDYSDLLKIPFDIECVK